MDIPADDYCLINSEIDEEDSVKNLNCGLNLLEYLVIRDYSGFYYSCMNRYLRNKDVKSPAGDAYVALLNRALDKLPNYQGIVLRGADLPKEIAEAHKKGNIVTYNAFTSTSTESGFPARDNFIMISKTGKPIMGLSSIAYEKEVLFKTGTKFEVLDTYSENGKNFYIMKESIEGQTPEAEKLSDLETIKKIKESESNGVKGDFWSCPKNGDSIPKNVVQEVLPLTKKSETNVDGANAGASSGFEFKAVIAGIMMNCKMTQTGTNCSPMDMKKGPLKDEPNFFQAVDAETEKIKTCNWLKEKWDCVDSGGYVGGSMNGSLNNAQDK